MFKSVLKGHSYFVVVIVNVMNWEKGGPAPNTFFLFKKNFSFSLKYTFFLALGKQSADHTEQTDFFFLMKNFFTAQWAEQILAPISESFIDTSVQVKGDSFTRVACPRGQCRLSAVSFQSPLPPLQIHVQNFFSQVLGVTE